MADSAIVTSNVVPGTTVTSGVTSGSTVSSTVSTSSANTANVVAGGVGATGATGATGAAGADGQGVPVGGTTGQVLSKNSNTDYDTEWSTVSGTGDVVGPAGATDNAVVRFDSTTGKLLQDSTTTLADNGYLQLAGSVDTAGAVITDTISEHSAAAGVTVDGVLIKDGAIAKAVVGLGNVDNTADTAKPVSTAQQTALNLKANLISPTITTPILQNSAADASVAYNSKVLEVQSTDTASTNDTMRIINAGQGNALQITQTNTSNNDPIINVTLSQNTGIGLKIDKTNALNSEGNIRLDGQKPEIEFVDHSVTGGYPTGPAGKFEIRSAQDDLQINGRNAGDSGFEEAFLFKRLASGGGLYILGDDGLNLNAGTSSSTKVRMSYNSAAEDNMDDYIELQSNYVANNDGDFSIHHKTSTGGDTTLLNIDSSTGVVTAGGAVIPTVSSTATLTNKTLTSPVINTPTGIVKGDVGLGNVDNTSNATERAATATLTNKRITKRTGTATSSATPTPDADAHDVYTVTALAAGATFGAPTGTPTEGQSLVIRVKDNGTARSLAYNAIYRAVGVTLPTTTVISKTIYLGMFYNSSDTKWDVVAVAQEA